MYFLRHAITEQHVTGGYRLTVDTLFGDDGVAALQTKREKTLFAGMDGSAAFQLWGGAHVGWGL